MSMSAVSMSMPKSVFYVYVYVYDTPAPPSPPFNGAKFFFHVKSENIKYLHVNNMWDFSLFFEQDISDKN